MRKHSKKNQAVRGDDDAHGQVGIHPQRERESIRGPDCGARIRGSDRTDATQKKPGRGEGPEHQAGIAARILRKPHVMVGDGHEGGGQQRLAVRGHSAAAGIERGNAEHPEDHRGQTQRPVAFAEGHQREMGQQRIEQVLIFAGVGGENRPERKTRRLDERGHFVVPKLLIESDKAQDSGEDSKSGQLQPRKGLFRSRDRAWRRTGIRQNCAGDDWLGDDGHGNI